MRLLITGASGFLGSHLVKAAEARGYEVLGTCHRNRSDPEYLPLDLCDSEAIARVFQDFHADVVIHTAAQANTAFVEKKPQLAYKANVDTTANLAESCEAHGIPIIFISTSYVFSGRNVPPGGYTPKDQPDPLSTYGQQKFTAEKALLAAGPAGKSVVLRIPLLYSLDCDSPKHWLSELLGELERGKPVLADYVAERRPTQVRDVCRVLLDLAHRCVHDFALPPILHFSSQQALTKLELVRMVARQRDMDESLIQPFDNVSDGVERPLVEHLSSATLHNIGIDSSFTKLDLSK